MTPLDAAHRYATMGWRVIPIVPGKKMPSMERWVEVATSDHDKIDDWWSRWATFGVGVVTGGPGHLFVLDIDEHHPAMSGSETLADLEATYGSLPETVECHTGSGGRHLYFVAPVEVRNDAGKRLGPGLDIRGEGGQVLAPPTIHPNGREYVWELEHSPEDCPVAPAPQWLVKLLTAAPDESPRTDRFAHVGPERPGDRFTATVTWPELLLADGATFLSRRVGQGSSYEMWARPGVDHASGTLYYGGTDVLKVFSSNWPGLTEGETYTRFGYFVATRFGGDFAKAARELGARQREAEIAAWVAEVPRMVEEIPEESSELTTWERVDLEPILEGTAEPIRPAVLTRDDGVSLFYAERINALAGESGHGKSWIALVACVEVMIEGRNAGYIDLEDHPRSIVGRLLALGATATMIADQFFYMRPERRPGTTALELVDALIVECALAVLVIDSVGEVMAMQGLKQNDDDAVADWYRQQPRRWAALGPAVILVDHVPKSPDAPKLFAIGSHRKKAAIDGALYRVEERVSMAIGEHGIIGLICAKDRHGTFANGAEVALCHFQSNPQGEQIAWQVKAGAERDEDGKVMRPTFIMEKVSKVLEHGSAITGRQVETQVRGTTKTRSATVRDALRVLVEEGFVGAHDGPRRAVFYHSIKAFRDEADALESLSASRASDCVPSEAGTQSTHATDECVRASHPFRGDALDALAVGAVDEVEKDSSESRYEGLF